MLLGKKRMTYRANGLVPVALDIDWQTLCPTKEEISAKITSLTKAIVFAYPYGKRYQIDHLAKYCKSFDLKIIEDASEAFSGVWYHGSPLADLSMFSFGMLKHFTAFGGSVSIVRTV